MSFDGSTLLLSATVKLLTCVSFTCNPEGNGGSPSLSQPKLHLGHREKSLAPNPCQHRKLVPFPVRAILPVSDVASGGGLSYFQLDTIYHSSILPALSTSKYIGHLVQ